MSPSHNPEITAILARLSGDGASEAYEELLPLVYQELRKLARSARRKAGGSATLDTTALVHEAYLRLVRHDGSGYAHRGHFFAVVAAAMRQLLVDQARRRGRAKRGSGQRPVTFDRVTVGIEEQCELVLAVDQALSKLAERSPRLRRVVECRFFAGLSELETAAALEVTERTVRRDWVKAKAWLQVELEGGGERTGPTASH